MPQDLTNLPERLFNDARDLAPEAVFRLLTERFPDAVTFSTSFSNEDQVITHLIAGNQLPIALFTLDTGRLFQKTYEVWSSTIASLGVRIKAYYPDAASIQSFTESYGPNAFYQSTELRKECCSIRKVLPLKLALAGHSVWITGLRAEHSPNRSDLQQFEYDAQNDIIKYHPLLHWTTDEVSAYIRKHRIPYNTLSDQGFVSIGCEPCTRAIAPGEDFRAGRWWWEDAGKKECGLHVRSATQTITT